MEVKPTDATRRGFLKTSAGVAAALTPMAVARNAYAAGSDRLRVGVIGCGNRGGDAAANILQADPAVEIYALADPTESQFDAALESVRATSQKDKVNIDGRITVNKERMFTGLDGYKHLVGLREIDIVLITSPVAFHPLQLTASVNAGKHTFMEKPAGVDPFGIRQVIAAGELAKQKGLAIVAGTQRRHQAVYRANYDAVQAGALGGPILGGRVWWCGGDNVRNVLRTRRPNESDAEFMTQPRGWYNFADLCGDHIVEQHVHNIDVANWFIGRNPVTALGFGMRARREAGNRYDFFSIDFDYGESVSVHSMCRQINGCYTKVSEHFIGPEGSVYPGGKIEGKQVDVPEYEEIGGPYVQEHRDLIASIRAGKPVNEAENVANSTLAAIMGRISAYTGQVVRWIDVAENKKSPYYNMRFDNTPEAFETGNVVMPPNEPCMLPGKEA